MKIRFNGLSCLLAVLAIGLGVVQSGCVSGVVWGVVTDVETGQPIEGAQVTFQDSLGGTGATTSGAGGVYAFFASLGQPIPAFTGTVTYRASAPGYDTLTLEHEQTMSMPRTIQQLVPLNLIPIGQESPLPGCRGVTFSWVYQPNGSTDFVHGVVRGKTCLNGFGNHEGFIFATGKVVNPKADVYLSCEGLYHGYYPWGPAFWANNGNGGVHDMGKIPSKDVTSAPDKAQGVGDHQFYNDQGVLTIPGHVYTVVTMDGQHYAKIELQALSCG